MIKFIENLENGNKVVFYTILKEFFITDNRSLEGIIFRDKRVIFSKKYLNALIKETDFNVTVETCQYTGKLLNVLYFGKHESGISVILKGSIKSLVNHMITKGFSNE